ncbi:hypothetical protein PSQ90_12770 [Devosia rhodophyticola]|uniref:Uncharacterized protein n=1 Tax=Devosia rhodophyticola TaxID=3026423 RepID=A0ABY7YVE8_9HYPH|nr:hypothetical protein [Devosia rhodophyticola]WDR05157.1 hypothetical protein PSQ90_12770 [Devosia rhodophyticola]
MSRADFFAALQNYGRPATLPVPTVQQLSARPEVAREAATLSGLKKLDAALGNARFLEQSRYGVTSFEERYDTAPKYKLQASYRTEPVTQLVPIYEARDVTEQRAIFGQRDVFETRDVFEERDVFEDRPIFETRNVYETRDVFEDRPIYETRDIYETIVDGSRDISSFSNRSASGVDIGADFSVKVGDGSLAVVKFSTNNRIAVTKDGTTTNFNFSTGTGEFGKALVLALDSIEGLDASLSGDGKLGLQTVDAQSLTLASVANGFLDFSGDPFADLGLQAGTTEASVTGTEQVQIGTEQVKIGTEDVLVGTEEVQVGTEQVKIGTEQVKTGAEQVKTGEETVQTGVETVVVGTEQVQVGTQTITTGTQQVESGRSYVRDGEQQIFRGYRVVNDRSDPDDARLTTESRRAIVAAVQALDTAIGPDKLANGADNRFAGLRDQLDLDKVRFAFIRGDLSTLGLKLAVALKAYGDKAAANASASGRYA